MVRAKRARGKSTQKRGRSEKPQTSDMRVGRELVIADRVITTLRYFDEVNSSFTSAGNAYAAKQWRLNSVYDPDFAIGGNSALGLSAYANFYNRYRVLAARWRIHICNLESSCPISVVCAPDNVGLSAPTMTDVTALKMNPYSQDALLSVKGGLDRSTLTGEIDMQKMAGFTGQRYEKDFSALTGDNPQDGIYLILGFFAVAGGLLSSGGGMGYQIVIDYDVEFYDRKLLV